MHKPYGKFFVLTTVHEGHVNRNFSSKMCILETKKPVRLILTSDSRTCSELAQQFGRYGGQDYKQLSRKTFPENLSPPFTLANTMIASHVCEMFGKFFYGFAYIKSTINDVPPQKNYGDEVYICRTSECVRLLSQARRKSLLTFTIDGLTHSLKNNSVLPCALSLTNNIYTSYPTVKEMVDKMSQRPIKIAEHVMQIFILYGILIFVFARTDEDRQTAILLIGDRFIGKEVRMSDMDRIMNNFKHTRNELILFTRFFNVRYIRPIYDNNNNEIDHWIIPTGRVQSMRNRNQQKVQSVEQVLQIQQTQQNKRPISSNQFKQLVGAKEYNDYRKEYKVLPQSRQQAKRRKARQDSDTALPSALSFLRQSFFPRQSKMK